ncbi:Nuclear autoantigen Sp-100 (Fragment) [Seminavis robusta]|uniref:Nuclear autoantigen Sp-100 n=1 Tax=Seminavis robusta TaxID=568900 RepID=A0A9N8HX41_9STRA
MAKKEQSTKFKKAPQAPRRFKSAYMFFSTEKHKTIRQEHCEKLQTTDVAKMVSQAWKDLPPDEREEWEEMARRDKARYEVEKTMYTGPWKVPATKARSQKDPNAPKRPMSAFLSYSNSKRAAVKAQNPEIGNAEVSRILAKMWKEAPEEERKIHIDKEFELRQQYKSAIAIWRQNADDELKAVRKKREDIALQRLDSPEHQEPQLHDSAAASPVAAAVDSSENANPQPQYMASNNHHHHHHAEQEDGDTGGPKSPGAAPGYHPPYAMGYGQEDSNGMVPVPMAPPYGGYRGTGVEPGRVPYGMMMPANAYSGEAYAASAEYGAHPNGFEQHGYDPHMVGFYGGYYPPPQMAVGPDPGGMGWGGPHAYYSPGRGAVYNPAAGASPPPPQGFMYGGGHG